VLLTAGVGDICALQAARAVEGTATYSSWVRGQPRMLAVAVGVAAALEMGDGKKALSFLTTVLQYDPDQSEVS
jgi:hypothetical protein